MFKQLSKILVSSGEAAARCAKISHMSKKNTALIDLDDIRPSAASKTRTIQLDDTIKKS